MYPFMTLNDKTEIVHSEARYMDGKETVKVYFERPVMNGFDSAECWLPAYRWENINGFSEKEIAYFQELLESTAHIIISLAREGGLSNAANL
jgi:hypothetical protein